MAKSNMHYRWKFTFNHKETSIIDTALEDFENLFKKEKDYKTAKEVAKVRKSLIHQEQAHWNKENGYPKGFLMKKKRK